MSIVIIRGPDKPMNYKRDPLSQYVNAEIIAALVDSAVCAGRTLAIRACGSNKEVVDALAMVERNPPEILLIDPGISLADSAVQTALRRISVPFIEIHDDTAISEEPELSESPPNRLEVVHGYMAQSYNVAMSKALDHLGCAQCQSDYHVGT